MTDWMELEKRYFMSTFKRLPLTLVRGQGARVWDDAGREYLDCMSGIGVNVLGHSHPAVLGALREQADELIHVSNLFYNIPQIRLAELLVEHSCLDKVFFGNSGAEANEGAVKLARKYGRLNLGGAYEVISTMGSFHGRTLAMTAATGQFKFQEAYIPLPSGFVNVPFNDLDAIREATTAATCAVMLETVQGEGGVNIADEDYLGGVRAWCDEKGLLLILDEIQTGLGRTGALFSYELFGIEPDIMTLAKGLGGGIPIGAILARERAAVFVPGDHGSTFGGNPLACAVACATLKFIIENDIPRSAGRVGEYLLSALGGLRSRFGFITDVRGRGLLVALGLDGDFSEEIVGGCLEGGLLLNAVQPNAVRFIPPLIITEAEVDEAVGVLAGVLEGVGARRKGN